MQSKNNSFFYNDVTVYALTKKKPNMQVHKSVELIGGCLNDKGEVIEDSLLKRNIGFKQWPIKKSAPVTKKMPNGYYAGVIFNHFGHFLLEGLSRLSRLPDNNMPVYFLSAPGSKLNSIEDCPSYMKELLLSALGDREVVFINEDVRFDSLYIPPAEFIIQEKFSEAHKIFLRGVGDAIKKKHEVHYDKFSKLYENKKVWLSRSKLKAAKVAYEEKLEECLSRENVCIVHAQELNIVEQIAIFDNARYVLGFTGSAFHPVIFSRPNNLSLVHFQRGDLENYNFKLCSDVPNVESAFIKTFLKTAYKVPHNTNFVNDLNKVQAYLQDKGIISNIYNLDFDIEQAQIDVDKCHPKGSSNIRLRNSIKYDSTPVDVIRESALHFERIGDYENALKLMSIAHEMKPSGAFIKNKLKFYSEKVI